MKFHLLFSLQFALSAIQYLRKTYERTLTGKGISSSDEDGVYYYFNVQLKCPSNMYFHPHPPFIAKQDLDSIFSVFNDHPVADMMKYRQSQTLRHRSISFWQRITVLSNSVF